MPIVDVRPTVEAPDDDPYLWLEETAGSQALAWVEGQNAATMNRLSDTRFAADRDALKLIFDRIGAERSCLIFGRTPNIHAVCGDDIVREFSK